MDKPSADIIVKNCSELLTMAGGGGKPKKGTMLNNVGMIRRGAVGISDGVITWVGREDDIGSSVKKSRRTRVVDAEGGVVMPGFVDPHTHIVFAGSRENEWLDRLAGKSYLSILKAGGGIISTVKATRKAKKQDLIRKGLGYLRMMLDFGTTTIEAKSGYGLTLKDEIKILECIKELNSIQPVDVVPTFLGAHALPPEFERKEDYVKLVADTMVPEIARRGLASYCDVFCERGAFSAAEAKRILEAGVAHGLKPKIHTNQFNDIGGTEVAAKIHPESIDHLDVISKKCLDDVATAGSVAVLLPGAAFFLDGGIYPDAKAMIAAGVPLALGTDFNPGTSFCYSMQFILSLACIKLGLSVEQALNCATINAAHAIGMGGVVGSLDVGKQADIIIMDLGSYKLIPYSIAGNNVNTVIKKGFIHKVKDPHKADWTE